MRAGLDAIERNCTWTITYLPQGKRAIGCKYVDKVKLNYDRTVDRYKARLVANALHVKKGSIIRRPSIPWQSLPPKSKKIFFPWLQLKTGAYLNLVFIMHL